MLQSIVTSAVTSGHSAKVEMTLIVDGKNHRISQLGPDFLILENGARQEASDAVIVVEIDGDEERLPVFLPKGLSISQKRTPLVFPE